MSDLVWPAEKQVERLRPHFPKVRGRPGSVDRTVSSGIIDAKRNGLRWRDAPPVCGPHETLCNRVVRWSRPGVFARVLGDLARPGAEGGAIVVDSTHLKPHRAAASLSKGGSGRGRSGGRRVG